MTKIHKLNILVDGRSLSKPLTGVNRTLTCFLNSPLANRHNIVILTTANLHKEVKLKPETTILKSWIFHLVLVNFKLSKLFKKFNYLSNFDIFWSPAHRVPYGIPETIKVLLFIHDLISQKHPCYLKIRTVLRETIFLESAIKRADIIVTPSKQTEQDLNSYFPRFIHKAHIIPLGCDHFKIPLHTKVERNLILFVGTIEVRKNVDILIQAFADLPLAIRKKNKLCIVGNWGWKIGKVKDSLKNIDGNTCIDIKTNCTDEKLLSLYLKSKVVVYPSSYEGFGLTIFESVYLGVPFITTNFVPSADAINDFGEIIYYKNKEELRKSLTLAICNPTEFNDKTIRLSNFRKKYSWRNISTKLETLLLESFNK